MKKALYAIGALLLAALPLAAQNRSSFAGLYNANDFSYGASGATAPLRVSSGATAGGTYSVTLYLGVAETPSGLAFAPISTSSSVTIGIGASQETVTPSSVSGCTLQYPTSCSFTATFTYAHGQGDVVQSGTFGLQEALNVASAKGGGTVIADASWTSYGGTSTIFNAATVPSGVTLWDNRAGIGGVQTATVAIPNASVLTLNTVGYPLIPAPGAGKMIQVERLVVEQVAKTAAFTGGGNITAAYGTQASQTAATGTIAATVFTGGSGTTNQIGQALPVAVANGNASVLLNSAVGLYAATADFAAGGGTAIVKVSYRILSGF